MLVSCPVCSNYIQRYFFSISRNRNTPGAPGSTNYDVDLSPVNNENIADDVLLLLREAIKDVQRRKHRPEIISGSGEGSASGEGRKKIVYHNVFSNMNLTN